MLTKICNNLYNNLATFRIKIIVDVLTNYHLNISHSKIKHTKRSVIFELPGTQNACVYTVRLIYIFKQEILLPFRSTNR